MNGFSLRKQLPIATVTRKLVVGESVLGANPTVVEVPASATGTDDGGYQVLHAVDIEIPASKVVSATATLSWTSQTSSGAGSTKWAVGPTGQTPGSAPIGATDISDVVVASGSKADHDLSGAVKESVFTSGAWSLLLLGKPDDVSESLTATIKNTSQLEITYIP